MRTFIFFFVSCLCGTGLWPPGIAKAQTDTPLKIEDVLSAKKVAPLMPLSISPDGKQLAYSIQDPQRSRSIDIKEFLKSGVPPWGSGTDIAIAGLDDRSSAIITGSIGDNWLPSWSPDGHYVAFLSDRDGDAHARLWLWDVRQREIRRASKINLCTRTIEWTPDSRSVIVTAMPQEPARISGMATDPSSGRNMGQSSHKDLSSTVYTYTAPTHADEQRAHSDPWNLNDNLRDLLLIDVATGQDRMLVKRQRIETYLLSTDGTKLAYTVPQRFERPGSQQIIFDLAVLGISGHGQQVVASQLRLPYDGASFSWSPDSNKLALCTGGMDERVNDCFLVEPATHSVRNLTSFSTPQESPRKLAAPLWDTSGHIYFLRNGALWQAGEGGPSLIGQVPGHTITNLIGEEQDLLWEIDNGRSTVVVTHDDKGKQDGFFRIDLSSGEATPLLEAHQCYTCSNLSREFSISNDGQRLAYLSEDNRRSSDIWSSDPEFEHPHQLTHLNPQLEGRRMGNVMVVDWLSDDGKQLRGALLLPAGYVQGKRYPLVTWVYGGLYLSDLANRFGIGYDGPFNMQLLASNGYAVLLPDAPLQPGTPMLDLAKSVLPGVSKIVEMGVADPDHLAVFGHSFGGYSVLSLLVQTKRFKAAIACDGYGDLFSEYGQMDKDGAAFGTANTENGIGSLGGTPWEVRERYIENSPNLYLDRVDTPLLLIHGDADVTAAPFLSDETFVDLRRLGKEVELAKYGGEGHSPLIWSYANQVDLSKRIIAWFNKYLKTDAVSTTSQVPR